MVSTPAPTGCITHVELIRAGLAWVGVSAQAVGVNALKARAAAAGDDPCGTPALSHPGDSYSYDIFSQAGQAIRDNAEVVLGGLKPKPRDRDRRVAVRGRLVTYIDAVHPVVDVYDGYLVHSRRRGGAPLSQAAAAGGADAHADAHPRRPRRPGARCSRWRPTPASLQARQRRQPRATGCGRSPAPRTTTSTACSLGADRHRQAARPTWPMVRDDAEPDEPAEPASAAICRSTPDPPPTCSAPRSPHLDDWVAKGHATAQGPAPRDRQPNPVQYATDANGNVRGASARPPSTRPSRRSAGWATAVPARSVSSAGCSAPRCR